MTSRKLAAAGVVSVVACLEDAIGDTEVATAEHNLIGQLSAPLPGRPRCCSSGSVRPTRSSGSRWAGRAQRAADRLRPSEVHRPSGAEFLDAVRAAGDSTGRPLLAMPILETADLAYAETRIQALLDIRALFEKFADVVLAVRLGATDLAATYGLRRSRDHTVYDIQLLASMIGDVVNVFGRAEGYSLVVTGPVWEYFSGTERIFKPLLRESPFIEHAERELRGKLIRKDLDGLIREVALDKANGLIGKTVIHPSHVAAVHALSVVTLEEYTDAVDILGTNAVGGAVASAYRNKMNESKPHTALGPAHPGPGRRLRGCERRHLLRRPARVAAVTWSGQWVADRLELELVDDESMHPRGCRSWRGWPYGSTPGGRTCWCRPCWASMCRSIRESATRLVDCSVAPIDRIPGRTRCPALGRAGR